MAKKTTVSEIAALANVSPATVSRVINHPELVKEDTVNAVVGAMEKLGVSDRKKEVTEEVLSKKDLLILNVQDINNVFYSEIIKSANDAAKAHNCDLLVTQYPLRKNSIGQFINLIKKLRASGVILLSKLDKTALDEIAQVAKIVQCCEYNEETDYPYIAINNYSSARAATEYLISTGRNKIAFLNGPMSYLYTSERQRGFVDAMNNAGIVIRPHWIVNVPKVDFNIAYTTVCQMLDSRSLPNAVFACSDILAAAAIKAIHHYNLNVPRDISVVGFDNIAFAAMSTPSITSVSQPVSQLGYTACEMLIENIINPETASKSILLNTEFVVRESSTIKITNNYN